MAFTGTENRFKKPLSISQSSAVRCSIAVLGKDVRNGGFALVISLTLMSFILMLLLSLTLLVQVELQSAQISLKRLIAKENARLGLMLAMGDLQRYAGPDERVTFSSTAYSQDEDIVANPHWTGVVNSRSPTNKMGEINWLVSSDREEPELPTTILNDRNSRVLVGASDSGINTKVRAPIKNIDTNTNKYAYWVSDDSSKASLATRPELDSQATNWLADSLSETQAKRLGQIIPKRSGIEVLFNPIIEDPMEIYNQISKVNSIRQVPLMDAWDFTNYDDYIHSVTDRSYGLLASTTGTGLRSDLSLRPEDMPIPGAFSLIENYKSYMEPPIEKLDRTRPYIPYEDDLRRRYNITAPSNISDGEISDGISPVLTDFKLLMSLHVAGGGGTGVVKKTEGSMSPILNDKEIVIRTHVYIELWNPYTSALVPENLVLRINNLPTLQVEARENIYKAPIVYNIDLQEKLNNGPTGADGYFIELPFANTTFGNDDDSSWLPGRVYSWTGQNNYAGSYWSKATPNALLGKFYNRDLNKSIWYAGTGTIVNDKIRYISISGPESSLSVSLLKKGAELDSGDALFIIDDIVYEPFETRSNNSEHKSIRFGFCLQRDESGFVVTSGDLAWNKSNWLRTEDPRSSRPTFDLTGERIGALLAPMGLDPALYTSTGVSNSQFLFDRTAGFSGLRPSEDVPLFELFRQRPVSLGELQHLKINNRRPFSIGNSWGSDNGDRFNRVFDEAFFSGLKAEDTESAFSQDSVLLPNHRLRSISEITGETMPELTVSENTNNNTSELLCIDGAFNINSTSSSAWAATLGSIQLPNWEIVNIDDEDGDIIMDEPTRTVNLGQSLLRYPQSAQEVYHTGEYSPYGDPPPTEYFRVGAKDSDNTKNPMSYPKLGAQIARRVADRIQLFGPFASIESFLAPVQDIAFAHPKDSDRYLSVVERAILDVPEINQSEGEDIWYHTSSFLSQADVMTALAPIVTVRGDTFTIRAFGETALDPSGKSTATAICEARVQRLPSTVNPNDNIRTPVPFGYGRRFVLTSMQWLSDE